MQINDITIIIIIRIAPEMITLHVQVSIIYTGIIITVWKCYECYSLEKELYSYNNYTGVEVVEEYTASHESAWYIPSKYLSSTHGLYRQS